MFDNFKARVVFVPTLIWNVLLGRWLKVREVAAIQGENPSTVYRKIDVGIYPGLVQFGGSSRMAGWELWSRAQQRLAERDGEAAR